MSHEDSRGWEVEDAGSKIEYDKLLSDTECLVT